MLRGKNLSLCYHAQASSVFWMTRGYGHVEDEVCCWNMSEGSVWHSLLTAQPGKRQRSPEDNQVLLCLSRHPSTMHPAQLCLAGTSSSAGSLDLLRSLSSYRRVKGSQAPPKPDFSEASHIAHLLSSILGSLWRGKACINGFINSAIYISK